MDDKLEWMVHRPMSHRGHRLLGMLRFPSKESRPCLTVEDYGKWYELNLVHHDKVEVVDFGVIDEHLNHSIYGSAYVDHVPNPIAVMILAKVKNWDLVDKALEVMVGRWEMEVLGKYSEDHITSLLLQHTLEHRK